MRLGLRLFVSASMLCGSLASAQAVNNNPAASDKPVFLDNHGPTGKKKDKAPTSRSLTGKVVDINGTPLEGALVTLTNTKTNSKTTFITKKDGRYEFSELSFSIDYELGARYKTFNASSRRLSQYDHNPNVVRILQIDDTANAPQTAEAKSSSTPSPR